MGCNGSKARAAPAGAAPVDVPPPVHPRTPAKAAARAEVTPASPVIAAFASPSFRADEGEAAACEATVAATPVSAKRTFGTERAANVVAGTPVSGKKVMFSPLADRTVEAPPVTEAEDDGDDAAAAAPAKKTKKGKKAKKAKIVDAAGEGDDAADEAPAAATGGKKKKGKKGLVDDSLFAQQVDAFSRLLTNAATLDAQLTAGKKGKKKAKKAA